MPRKSPADQRPVAPTKHDVDLDFDPDVRLKTALEGRAFEEGITIDPYGTRIIDDGLWLRGHTHGWTLKTHIADVPSIIPHNSVLEDVARGRREEQDEKSSLIRMFPGTFLDRYVSLHQGVERPAITFKIELDKTGAVKDYRVYRSSFRNRQQCDYTPLRAQFNMGKEDFKAWKDLARRLAFSRQDALAAEGDIMVNGPNKDRKTLYAPHMLEDDVMRTIVHESMLLTNMLATDFFKRRNVLAPVKMRGMYVEPISVSPDFEFERVCNKLCWKILNDIESQKDTYVRLTSPMRNFRDYTALKLMGRLLDSKEVEPELQQDVVKFSERFNIKAQERESYMISDRWRGAWNVMKQERGEHPFRRALQPGVTNSYAADLAEMCDRNNWKWPRVAERELLLQGTRIYFAGINFTPSSGMDRQAWAVSYDPDMALEAASQRMMKIIKPDDPAPSSHQMQKPGVP